jgi:hypothetical protein
MGFALKRSGETGNDNFYALPVEVFCFGEDFRKERR